MRSGRSSSAIGPQPGQVEHPADLVAVGLRRGRARAAAATASRPGIDRSTSSRTASPNRRRRSSSSIASRRSSASSSSIARSALRVTRKRWCSSTSMPRNSASRLASITWSIRTKRDGSDLEQPRQDLRDLDPGEAALAGLRIAQSDRDRQAERRDVRERMAGIDRERRQDREDLVEEALPERVVVLRDGRRSRRARCPRRRAPGGSTRRSRTWSAGELEDALPGGGELLLGRPAVGRPGDLAGLDLLAQAGDADLEELVEVAGEDGQELDPLEQRVAFVARLVQDPGVEVEPGQLAVEVREGRLRARRAPRSVARSPVWRERRVRWRPSVEGGLLEQVVATRRPGRRG